MLQMVGILLRKASKYTSNAAWLWKKTHIKKTVLGGRAKSAAED
jgi:hypothetical protein